MINLLGRGVSVASSSSSAIANQIVRHQSSSSQSLIVSDSDMDERSLSRRNYETRMKETDEADEVQVEEQNNNRFLQRGRKLG